MDQTTPSTHRVSRVRKIGAPKKLISVRLSKSTIDSWPRDEVSLGCWIDELAGSHAQPAVTPDAELRRQTLTLTVWAAANLDRVARWTIEDRNTPGSTVPLAQVLHELAAIRNQLHGLALR